MKKRPLTYFDCLWMLTRLRAGEQPYEGDPVVLEHSLLWKIQKFVGIN